MIKYFYKNKFSNQKLTAKPNLVWVADCTSLDLGMFPKSHFFMYKYSHKFYFHILAKIDLAIEYRFLMFRGIPWLQLNC